MEWNLAARVAKMNPSAIWEILKGTERPGIISFAGGFPSPHSFPVSQFKAACDHVLRTDPTGALQYAGSEGFSPLREMVAQQLRDQSASLGVAWNVDPSQVLITNGSQQGLDLVAKVLLDPGSRVLVESPTYLGAVAAFVAMEPEIVSVSNSQDGVDINSLRESFRRNANQNGIGGDAARFLYVLPNFQNPTGRTMSEACRVELSDESKRLGLPLIEDNPYGDIWFESPPPAPLTARNPESCIYLGSFSKLLAPGLRMGFMVAPKSIYPKLLQAKQASDLHSASFNQRLIFEVMKDGFLNTHVPAIRNRYRAQRDAMLQALEENFQSNESKEQGTSSQTVEWTTPAGGMFIWARLPEGINAYKLLPKAIELGVAFVPGAPFFTGPGDERAIRLSYVNPTVSEIHEGVKRLATAIESIRV